MSLTNVNEPVLAPNPLGPLRASATALFKDAAARAVSLSGLALVKMPGRGEGRSFTAQGESHADFSLGMPLEWLASLPSLSLGSHLN